MSRLPSFKVPSPPSAPLFFATLIRTHHITSRKKLQRVREAAARRAIPFVLVRYGGAPGAMYAEGPDAAALVDWVAAVRALRYKDFHWVRRPSAEATTATSPVAAAMAARERGGEEKRRPRRVEAPFNEVGSLAEFAEVMRQRGLLSWWRSGMGFPDRGHEG